MRGEEWMSKRRRKQKQDKDTADNEPKIIAGAMRNSRHYNESGCTHPGIHIAI